jgi:hypothetical protein
MKHGQGFASMLQVSLRGCVCSTTWQQLGKAAFIQIQVFHLVFHPFHLSTYDLCILNSMGGCNIFRLLIATD